MFANNYASRLFSAFHQNADEYYLNVYHFASSIVVPFLTGRSGAEL